MALRLEQQRFESDTVAPETQNVNARVERLLRSAPDPASIDEMRAARLAGGPLWGPVVESALARDLEVQGPACPLRVRAFVPERPRGVYLHLHGGGWATGGPHLHDEYLEALALGSEFAVVCPQYRLSPENPHPAAVDDCEAVARWLLSEGAGDLSLPHRFVIGGGSAGAHLAVLVLLRLRDAPGKRSFASAALAFGVYDLNQTPSARNWGDSNLVINTPAMQWFASMYCDAERYQDPEVSPLYADLADLPPALFSCGTHDPLLDDSLFMAARWTAAGGDAEVSVYPGGIHQFVLLPDEFPLRKEATSDTVRFLQRSAVES